MKINRLGDSEENEMTIEEMKAENERLKEARKKEILLAAAAWYDEKKKGGE
jgi:hypothetical protein